MELKDLFEQKGRVWSRMQEIMAAARAADRDLTKEESEEYTRAETDLEAIAERIGREQRHQETEKLMAEVQRDPRVLPGISDAPPADERAKDYERVFRRYLRFGQSELSDDERRILRTGFVRVETEQTAHFAGEQRDQGVATGAAGGFTVPETFAGRLMEHLIQAGTMRLTPVTILTTEGGGDLPFPKTTAHGAAAIVAEGAALSSADETFGEVVLQSYMYARLIKTSVQLLMDEEVGLEDYIGRELFRAVGALQNSHYVNGNGTGQPNGIVGASTLGKTGTAGQTTSIIADDLVDLFYSVVPPYRRTAVWMAADSSIKVIRKLKEGGAATNQYLWAPGLVAGEPDTILGRPVFDDPDVPVMAASARSVIFGDFSRYVIRDVRGFAIRRLDERFADSMQVGFIGWHRSDGDLIDLTGAVKHYANSAT